MRSRENVIGLCGLATLTLALNAQPCLSFAVEQNISARSFRKTIVQTPAQPNRHTHRQTTVDPSCYRKLVFRASLRTHPTQSLRVP